MPVVIVLNQLLLLNARRFPCTVTADGFDYSYFNRCLSSTIRSVRIGPFNRISPPLTWFSNRNTLDDYSLWPVTGIKNFICPGKYRLDTRVSAVPWWPVRKRERPNTRGNFRRKTQPRHLAFSRYCRPRRPGAADRARSPYRIRRFSFWPPYTSHPVYTVGHTATVFFFFFLLNLLKIIST